MTVQQIIDRIRRQTEESSVAYADAVLIDYINDALDDLTPVAKMLQSKSGIALTISSGNATIIITSDANLVKQHEVVNVYLTPTGGVEERLRRLPVGDLVSRGWWLFADRIELRNLGVTTGTARVEFYRKLAHVSAAADVPELPDQYHNLLVLYGCAKIQEREVAATLKRDFAAEYLAGRQLFALQRTWEMEPQNRPFIQQARLFSLLGVEVPRRGR